MGIEGVGRPRMFQNVPKCSFTLLVVLVVQVTEHLGGADALPEGRDFELELRERHPERLLRAEEPDACAIEHALQRASVHAEGASERAQRGERPERGLRHPPRTSAHHRRLTTHRPVPRALAYASDALAKSRSASRLRSKT